MNDIRNLRFAKTAAPSSRPLVVIVSAISILLILSLYLLLRYGQYLNMDGDTANFAAWIEAMRQDGGLVPDRGAYPHGYGYQALALGLLSATGLEIPTLQFYGGVLLAAWLAIPAWLLYRELTGSVRASALALMILLVQPEFLFPIMRGTHEKFTRGLMLIALYLLFRSLRSRQHFATFTGFVLAFYLIAMGLIAFNSLIAISFILAISLSLLLSWLLLRRQGFSPDLDPVLRRLAYAALVCAILALLFTLFLYEPARRSLRFLASFPEQLAVLFLDVESVSSTDIYAPVTTGWISVPIYFLLSLANWLVLAISALVWINLSVRWLRRRWQPVYRQTLLWSFYTAFAFITGLSILADWLGTRAASNLQLRAFPAFVMLAAPLIAAWFVENSESRRPTVRLGRAALLPLLALLIIVSVLKFTNEPVLGNQWRFYQPGEMAAVERSDSILAGRTLWTGFDNRLAATVQNWTITNPLDIRLDGRTADPDVRDVLGSEVIQARSLRLDSPIPVEADSFITYDNGQAQIYHLRPQTPFQR